MRQKRLAGVRAAFERFGLDAILIVQDSSGRSPNVRYLSGFTGSAAVLVVTEQRGIIGTDSRYWEQAATECPEYELLRLGPIAEEALGLCLHDLGAKRVGFESGLVTVAQHAKWSRVFDGVTLVPTDDLVESLRAAKDENEIDSLRRAVHLTDQAYDYAAGWIRPGKSEKEIAWELESHLRTHGAEGLSFEVLVASGSGTAEPHHRPGNRPVATGEPIWIDMGARVGGYCADLTRTFVLGDPDSRFREIYSVVLAAQQEAARSLRAGLSGRAADTAARQVISQAGHADHFGHGTGHGLGLAVHEMPRLGTTSEDLLVEGAVVTVEPGIYVPGWGGVRIEDVVWLRDGGAEILTKAPKYILPSR